METQTHSPQAGNGQPKPRKPRALSVDGPGTPLGELVNELFKLTAVAKLLEYGISGGCDDADCQATAEHLGDRLDDVTTRLAGLDVRPARRGAV